MNLLPAAELAAHAAWTMIHDLISKNYAPGDRESLRRGAINSLQNAQRIMEELAPPKCDHETAHIKYDRATGKIVSAKCMRCGAPL